MSDQTADIAVQATPAALPLRHDTILGVCQGISEDFGISPTWLRLAFAAMLFVHPVGTVVVYFALGLMVAAARLLAPDVQPIAPTQTVSPAEATDSRAGDDQMELPIAA